MGRGDSSSKSRLLEKETWLDLALDVDFISVLCLLIVGIRVGCFCSLGHICELISKMQRFCTGERPCLSLQFLPKVTSGLGKYMSN